MSKQMDREVKLKRSQSVGRTTARMTSSQRPTISSTRVRPVSGSSRATRSASMKEKRVRPMSASDAQRNAEKQKTPAVKEERVIVYKAPEGKFAPPKIVNIGSRSGPSVRPKTKLTDKTNLKSIKPPGADKERAQQLREEYESPENEDKNVQGLVIPSEVIKSCTYEEFSGMPAQPKDDIEFVEHTVKPEYRDYIQGKTDFPDFAFGKYPGTDPDQWDETEFPIEGPPNWSQIWKDWNTIGDDYKLPVPLKQAINKEQLKQLQKSKNEIRNIEFTSVLGKGSFGQVWEVEADRHDLITGAFVEKLDMACKVMRLQQKPGRTIETAVTRILADIQVLQQLSHENIVNFIDIIGIPDRITRFPYAVVLLLMELCEGDLNRVIQFGGVLEEKYCKIWFTQIAEAVRYLHSQNVVHMDIKPQNILYQYNDRAVRKKRFELKDINDLTFKLGDFGLSIAYPPGDPCTITAKNIGTYLYMAPEMKTKVRPIVDTKANDIHCLGITLAEVKMSQATVKAFDFYYILDRIVNENAPATKYHTTKNIAELIYQMIRKDPNNRLTIEQVLKHKWIKPNP